jgi:hypothetical protein
LLVVTPPKVFANAAVITSPLAIAMPTALVIPTRALLHELSIVALAPFGLSPSIGVASRLHFITIVAAPVATATAILVASFKLGGRKVKSLGEDFLWLETF